ncbi:type VI secretion system baseplate subunit TssF [Malaciobacter molluscorum LMG 25693]|uniref:Type VI secretion system baseplate subunit TssF n=1 Tax=Malaciobacter molluscorum LMG 25693 TaxID=870501 RepID=A0A2G1DI49_9BACT|nr:type VI secretion system baseplate subunit TssF [Malaciobacter molluscorum]AXX92434.1 type VI secretion system, baseplate protein [Malaciobacter molluscorum LMG 25693]PHO18120.1 type VI secretion system baseplate subunit TssF [Malaciobacter molluscorum LMG 25693]RXJ93910.1 type VI secretion system baseplate subunit TssF [Malaciobacter molluscorum]
MTFNDYYKKELSSLRYEGAEFSKKNPGLSSYLSKEGQDPDVERLLEGFSFLTGRLKQQLNYELPEVSHTLVQLLWPNYIRPIPSYSIIKYEALKDSTQNISIDKNTEVLSKSINNTQCKFRTSYNLTVMPFDLEKVNYFTYSKKSELELTFKMTASGTLSDITFETLRLYLGGSKFIAQDLYLFLINYIQNIEVSINSEDKQLVSIQLPKDSIKPVGFNNEDLLPYSLNVFDGYKLLQEYFCFKDKFLFVDIENLSNINFISKQILEKSRSFTIKINLNKKITQSETPTIENFHLYTTPIINIFETDSVPIRKTSYDEEYLVVPSNLDKNHCEVFSIENVRGWVAKKGIYEDYLPFESFEHTFSNSEYYSSKVKLTSDESRTNTYLRFANSNGIEEDLEKSNATVSVKILCTNKNLPSSLLLGDICIANPLSNSATLKFENITIPTQSYPPPVSGDFLWRVISNMSLNYLSLEDIKSLRTIVETYDFFGSYDIKQREKTSMQLNGIESVSYETTEMIDRGMPIRGNHIKLKINPFNFSSIGEAYIFCSVLNEFFSLYSNINSFHKLTVDMDNEDLFEWPIKLGSQTLL